MASPRFVLEGYRTMDVELMAKVEAAQGRNEKTALLKKLVGQKKSERAIKAALDPYVTFGITVDYRSIMDKRGGSDAYDEMFKDTADMQIIVRKPATKMSRWAFWSVLLDTLDDLAVRKLTGHSATRRIEEVLVRSPTDLDVDWACRVINKHLDCGVSSKTIEKVFPGLIQPFAVALAVPANFDKPAVFSEPGFYEPKIDGVRCVMIDGVPYSREGRVLQGIEGLAAHMRELIGDFRTEEFVYDGEVIGKGTFEETVGAAKKRGTASMTYHVFDVIRREEWYARKTRALIARKADLNVIANQCPDDTRQIVWIRGDFYVKGVTVDFALKQRDRSIALGYEGGMWKQGNAPYSFCRNDSLVKLKHFDTEDLEVIGVYEGEGKYEGMLGGIVCKIDAVNTVDCGGGFTDEQRKDLWLNKPIGRVAEIKYQNKTAKGSLRHPVFMRWRDDKGHA